MGLGQTMCPAVYCCGFKFLWNVTAVIYLFNSYFSAWENMHIHNSIFMTLKPYDITICTGVSYSLVYRNKYKNREMEQFHLKTAKASS